MRGGRGLAWGVAVRSSSSLAGMRLKAVGIRQQVEASGEALRERVREGRRGDALVNQDLSILTRCPLRCCLYACEWEFACRVYYTAEAADQGRMRLPTRSTPLTDAVRARPDNSEVSFRALTALC